MVASVRAGRIDDRYSRSDKSLVVIFSSAFNTNLDSLLTIHHLAHYVSELIEVYKCGSVDFQSLLRVNFGRQELLPIVT